MPARRAETAQRARQGSPVAKRHAQKQHKNRRHRSEGQQRHRNLLNIVMPWEETEPKGRMQHQVSGAAGAAHR